MTLTIYGSPRSRTMRVLWLATELDLLYEHIPYAFDELANPMIDRSLAVLVKALAEDSWLVGSRFTAADLNVAGVLSPSRSRLLDLTRHPHVTDWLDRCYSRPAAKVVRRRFQA